MRTCVRLKPIRSIAALGHITAHARRSHASVQGRVDNSLTMQTLAASAYSDDPLDVVAAYKTRTAASGAVQYGRAPIAAHLLLSLPPAIIDEGGDRHDRDNLVSRALFEQGIAWAERVFGAGSVIAARLDCDEVGCGVQDVVVVPIRTIRVNRYALKNIVSVSGALEELRAQYSERTSYAALQTSWAEHATAFIDARLERGVTKEVKGRESVDHWVFRPAAEAHREQMEDGWRQHRAMIDEDRVRQQTEWRTIKSEKRNLAFLIQKLKEKAERLEIERRQIASIPRHYRLCARAYVLGYLKLIEGDGGHQLAVSDIVPENARGELKRIVEQAKKAGFDPWLLRRLRQEIEVQATEFSDHHPHLRL